MNINYLQFLLKAKGRHGTHSPFVYHYADTVMHGNRKFYLDEEIDHLKLNGWRKVQKRLFFQTIDFLQLTHVYIDLENNYIFKDLETLIRFADGRIKFHTTISNLPNENQSCIIALTDQIIQIPSGYTGYLLLLNPHKNESHFDEYLHHPHAKLTIDCWHWGIIIFNPAFKQMHHYLIK